MDKNKLKNAKQFITRRNILFHLTCYKAINWWTKNFSNINLLITATDFTLKVGHIYV